MDAKCACQKCGGHILFDCSGLKPDEARAVECPHCHQETLVYVPQVPLDQAPPPPVGLRINKPSTVTSSHPSVAAPEQPPLSNIVEANQRARSSSATSRNGLNYANYLLIAVLALSVLAFFMPNFSISIPVLGKIEVSMFDFFNPKNHAAQNGSEMSAKPSFSFKDLKNNDLFQFKKASVGVLLCLASVLGLLGHYLFSVLWAVLNFAFRKSFRIFNWFWLGLAIQFPILFTLGTHLALAAFKDQMTAEAGKSSGGGDAFAAAFTSNISVGPAAMMWVLFGIALAAFLLPPVLRRNA